MVDYESRNSSFLKIIMSLIEWILVMFTAFRQYIVD